MRRGAFWLILVAVALLATAGCGGNMTQAPPVDERVGVVTATAQEGVAAEPLRPPPRFVGGACNRAFQEAASLRDLWHTVENLFPALDACDSLAEWVGASYHNRGAIVNEVDPVRFADTACRSYGRAASAPVCKDLGY
jgi:hypothetical protein